MRGDVKPKSPDCKNPLPESFVWHHYLSIAVREEYPICIGLLALVKCASDGGGGQGRRDGGSTGELNLGWGLAGSRV